MRTTVDLDLDVLDAARELARSRGSTLGAVISELVRAGLRPAGVELVDGLPVVRARLDAPLITSEMVRRALDDQ